MKYIINNSYIECLKCQSYDNENQLVNFDCRTVILDDKQGYFLYNLKAYNSLTDNCLFSMYFDSDNEENEISIVYFNDIIVINSGKRIILLDNSFNIINLYDFWTPVFAFYVLSNMKLLMLEELGFAIINAEGEIIRKENTDLFEDYTLKDNVLTLKMDLDYKIYNL